MRYLITLFLFFPILLDVSASNNTAIDLVPKTLQRELVKINLTIDSAKQIEGITDYNLKGSYYQITNQTDSLYYYVGRVNSCRANGCAAGISANSSEVYEYFDYYILFDTKGVVKTVKVYNYQATHGMEITIKGWLKQFLGYFGEKELIVGKDVDAISGATISVFAITSDLEYRTKCLNSWLKK